MNQIKVLKSGIYSSVQDLGRTGYRKFGVPNSGAMDQLSSGLANLLLDNEESAAVIEMALIGPELEFSVDTYIVVTGADNAPKVNDQPILLNTVYLAKAHSILKFHHVKNGLYTYLGVYGGIQTPKIMHSRSFYHQITTNHQLKPGDVLPITNQVRNAQALDSSILGTLSHLKTSSLKAFKGPEFELLTNCQQDEIFKQVFEVTNHYNRMGYRLNSNPLILQDKHRLTSSVLSGTVQLTPSGMLIVLMRDGQTTGGYPRILQLSEHSINVLAQKKVNDQISFSLIDV